MIYTVTAGGVVVNSDGEILIVNQHGRAWSLPKGHLEVGEDLLTTAKREIKEESGVSDLHYIQEWGTYQRNKMDKEGKNDDSEFKTIAIFLFHTNQNHLEPIDPHNPQARWVPKDEVVDLLTHEKDKEFWLSVKDKVV
jgi:8-oxo-dGTP diphosphatase